MKMERVSRQIKVIGDIKKKVVEDFNGTILYVTISGAHLYGFESANSDVDYRGAFITGTNNLLGLHSKRDVIEMMHGNDDIALFEIKKELELALAGNCNVLEHINAKPILTTPEFLEMRQLVNNAFGKKGLYNSYKGMATFNYKKFILGGKSTPKKYLYVFRGLMAGIHVLQTGKIEANINRLNDYFTLSELEELIELKKQGLESEPIPTSLDTGKLETRISYLFNKIDEAYMKSPIPEKPTEQEIEQIDIFLKQTRKNYL